MKGVIKAELVEVIRIRVNLGTGTEEDPVRTEVQYWDKNGKLLCKTDYLPDNNA